MSIKRFSIDLKEDYYYLTDSIGQFDDILISIDNFSKICDILNKLDENCLQLSLTLDDMSEKSLKLKETISSTLYEEVVECERLIEEYSDKKNMDSVNKVIHTNGRMETTQKLIKELL